MPYIWGEFETSLRGSKVNAEDVKKILHKTCSGHAHGHGVAKVAGLSLLFIFLQLLFKSQNYALRPTPYYKF